MKKVEISEAALRKFPEWIVFVIAADPDGRHANLMPAGWVSFCSGNPPMVSVAIHPNRHTHKLIEASGEFILAWAGEGQEDLVKQTGSTSGRDRDKFDEFGLTKLPASVVKAPLLAGCAMAFECKVAGELVTGDHTIFAGRIVAAHVSDPPVEKIVNFGKERYVAAQIRG
jgi:flavin reductase (DIM6/NTAB) family NADH-FMN oxidoreductase RutF